MPTHSFARPFWNKVRLAAVPAVLCSLLGCAAPMTTDSDAARLASTLQPVAIHGSLAYSNNMFLTYHRRHAVALVDLHGFVERDPEWQVPLDSLTFGRLDIDYEQEQASYQIDLPLRPEAVDNSIGSSNGVKLYAVAYWDDPFDGNETIYGWPTYLTSLNTDAERNDEIIGGKLIAWAPNDQQFLPSDFGGDHQLFTDDDPLQPLPAGYSVIDLDQRPFAIDRSTNPELAIIERFDLSTKDLSQLSYRGAFEQLFAQVRREYAFNGIAGKEPEWDEMLASVGPQILQAQQENDPKLFFLALRQFINGLPDGHSYVSGGDLEDEVDDTAFGGGYGFAVRELDDKRAMVVGVLDDGPADQAGVREGAVVHTVNGLAFSDAVDAVSPPTGPFSMEQSRRYDQVRYLLRAPIDTSLSMSFTNPHGKQQTADLVAIEETYSLRTTSIYRGSDPTALPIEYWILDSGIGYVRINSNDDDLDLIDELFQRALDSFDYNDVPSIIVDMRQNDGGTNLDLAGYLIDEPIELGQLAYFSESTGRFEPDGPIEYVTSSAHPYTFDRVALLVGPACFSACEIEAYGFSRLPNAIVVGSSPTAGVEAEVARGSFELPEDIYVQIPTGRYINTDGSLFLEGSGVVPTVRVPVNEQTMLSDKDEILHAAETALLDE